MKFTKLALLAAFSQMIHCQLVSEPDIVDTFNLYDADKNNFVSKEEFLKEFTWETNVMANGLSERYPREMSKLVDGFFWAYDVDRYHGFNLAEFTSFMREELDEIGKINQLDKKIHPHQ